MKKFLSMVMAAAMVVSLVPATAFAAKDNVKATASIVDAESYSDGELERNDLIGDEAELQLRFTTADYASGQASIAPEAELEFTLDNAVAAAGFDVKYIRTDDGVYEWDGYGFKGRANTSVANDTLEDVDGTDIIITSDDYPYDGKDNFTINLVGKVERGWILGVTLHSEIDRVSKGKTATVTVESSDIKISNGDDLVYASIEDASIDVSVKDTVDVAEDEIVTLEDITIEAGVGDFADFVDNESELVLKLNSSFEFVKNNSDATFNGVKISAMNANDVEYDDDELTISGASLMQIVNGDKTDEWKIVGLKVDSADAKAGAVATLRVSLTGCDTVSTEVANVVEYDVLMSVDEDEDVPVIYSGVNKDNDGITDDSDHEALEVTLKETFAGAWNNSKDFTLTVPEGVYIVDVEGNIDNDGDDGKDPEVKEWFEAAYEEGDYVELTFDKRSWSETDPDNEDDPIELNFTLTLVADPNFEGDVVLKLTGDSMEEQEVTIAKFVKPYTVKAEQNDMKIDYRNTEIPTSVVITEAEAGLWDKDIDFVLALDKIDFDDEGTITIDDQSGLEVKDDEVKTTAHDGNDAIYFTVESRSDDEPASVTISGMQLYMDRSLPAGAYDLDLYVEGMHDLYEGQMVLNGDKDPVTEDGKDRNRVISDINDDFVSYTAKAGFVNIVTAGRDQDDSSFTTKVVVPVGENYLIAGEQQVSLDVPAYISAAGYTMLPIRAVSYALGITTDSVLWDQPSRTVTVMYGSRIISMQNGQSVMYVNGSAIPMSGAVEIVDGRAFIPMRDLGVALGVSDIVWDASTRTATLNGSK